jgi:hypothetical protein
MSFLNRRKNFFIKIKSIKLKRTTSSIISFKAAQRRINVKGTSVVYLPVGDTPGIC